jgi:hypothetical protein
MAGLVPLTMMATLTLAPLSRKECIALLPFTAGISVTTHPPIPVEELDRARATITLKLCPKPIIDIDDIDDTKVIEPEDPCVKYAVNCEDGSKAATAILGRQRVTKIKWTGLSRALCDVSLVERSAASSSEVFALMRMRRPPNEDGQYNSHCVFLDGNVVNASLGAEIPLTNGSIIALHGPSGFAYQVCIVRQNAL